MFTNLYWIEKFENDAALAIMPRPRGGEWLLDEIKRLERLGIRTIVSLLEKEEMQEVGLREEGAICRNHRIAYVNLPIKDRQTPSEPAVSRLVLELGQKIEQGEKIVIHCRMGIGRASIVVGAVMLQRGLRTEQILEKITEVRGLKVPDTEEQIHWLKSRER